MTATLRAIASCDALPSSEAVEFLADFALLADRELLERGLSLHAEMHAWLSSAPEDLPRLMQLITHDGTDEIIRIADACERQGSFRPLSHQGVASAR